MADAKDRRTNMIHSSVNAQPAKEGAGGSYVWGALTSVTDYEPQGVGHVGLQIKKAAPPLDMPVCQDAYFNNMDDFPALAPAAGARPESLTYGVIGAELSASEPVPGFAAASGSPPVCMALPVVSRTTKRTTVKTDGMHGIGFATNLCEHPDEMVGGTHGGRGGRSSALTELSDSHACAGDFTSGYAQWGLRKHSDHGKGFATNQCEHPDMTVGGAHGGRAGRNSALTEMSSSHAYAGDFTSGYAHMPVLRASVNEVNADAAGSILNVEEQGFEPVVGWKRLAAGARTAKLKLKNKHSVKTDQKKGFKKNEARSIAAKRRKSGPQRPKLESVDSSATNQIDDSIPALEFEPDLSWQPLTAETRKGNLKAVRKEGGMVGIDLEGASHLGGTQFFCNRVLEPKGDQELLIESINAMNAQEKKVTRAHEVRAGCSADVAKMIVSANPCQVQVAAYVPKALQSKLTPSDWLNEVMTWYDGAINFQCSSGEMCMGTVDDLQGYGMGYEILIRHHSTDILQRLGLMASSEHVHHHEDEIFGDDHLPGMSEHRKSTIVQARKSTLNKIQSA